MTPIDPNPSASLDLSLLDGFRYACRPDCGLCCFATPRVSRSEREALLRIAPAVELVGAEPDRFLAARSDGGACQFLRDRRCGVHAARPAPCREFPVDVHVGFRLQASLVLSCPGIDLGGLLSKRPDPGCPPVGLDAEVAAVRERLSPTAARRVADASRRRRRIERALTDEDRWVGEDDVRAALISAIPLPGANDFPADDPPDAAEGLEMLPLFFDGRTGPVALGSTIGGWELLELRAEGGVARSLGVVPPPRRPVGMTAEARALLEAYLRYWLARDRLFGITLRAMAEAATGDVQEWVTAELGAIGALTLARAWVRARAAGRSDDPVSADDVGSGIRATDQDLLDRPTWGDRF